MYLGYFIWGLYGGYGG